MLIFVTRNTSAVSAQMKFFNSFFHELLVMEEGTEDDVLKFVIQLGAEFAKQAVNDGLRRSSNSVNPLEDRVVGQLRNF